MRSSLQYRPVVALSLGLLALGTGTLLAFAASPPQTVIAPATTAASPIIAGIPAAGAVGFLGDPASLRIVDVRSALPAGTSWDFDRNLLRVDEDNITLDGMYVKGGIDFSGSGTLTIRSSIIEGGSDSGFVMLARTEGSTLHVEDSTLRWRAGSTPTVGSGTGAIQIQASVRIVALRNDISGTADGIQVAGDDSRIEQNWIHDLAAVGTYPHNNHNDGIQIYHGERVVIAKNRIEIGFDGVHQNAALFLQPGHANAIPAIQITGNYLQGGGFTLRLEGSTTTGASVSDNIFGLLEKSFGHAYVTNGATVAEWSGNRRSDGTEVRLPDPA